MSDREKEIIKLVKEMQQDLSKAKSLLKRTLLLLIITDDDDYIDPYLKETHKKILLNDINQYLGDK